MRRSALPRLPFHPLLRRPAEPSRGRRPGMRWALLGSLPPVLLAGPASAQCLFLPGPGNDNFVCSSNSAPGLTDTGGNNTYSVVQQSGRIVGAVNQGDGADSYAISGGIVNGTIQQGNGTDDFRMT